MQRNISTAGRSKQAHCKPAKRYIACCCWPVLPCTPPASCRQRACKNKHKCYNMSYSSSRLNCPDVHIRIALRQHAEPHAHTCIPLQRAKCNTTNLLRDEPRKLTASLPIDISDAVVGPCSPAHLRHPVASERATTNTNGTKCYIHPRARTVQMCIYESVSYTHLTLPTILRV